ncbi:MULTISPECIES: hypothetical protein [Solibacillus]|uniref:Replication protein n=1 Tax=Solibacillus faecavium TaxID=2762221 RepID=A0ABR8Y3H5_9BACL|nr:hypothetical protein [Solibacillus faecavium]MBD8038574.1 hypothetical protein [Solibacillus faecavium]
MSLLLEHQYFFVSKKLGTVIGADQALLLQQLHYRLENQGVMKEGQKWYRQTYKNWSKQLGMWSAPKVKSLLIKLEKNKIVISTDKFNRFYVDRSKWYRIDYERVNQMLHTQFPEKNEYVRINKDTAFN